VPGILTGCDGIGQHRIRDRRDRYRPVRGDRAAYALITGQGPAWLREARERARAQAEQARQQAALAAKERKQIELNRERSQAAPELACQRPIR
jgi:hypothetical protein